jgi:hypothetical protein
MMFVILQLSYVCCIVAEISYQLFYGNALKKFNGEEIQADLKA